MRFGAFPAALAGATVLSMVALAQQQPSAQPPPSAQQPTFKCTSTASRLTMVMTTRRIFTSMASVHLPTYTNH